MGQTKKIGEFEPERIDFDTWPGLVQIAFCNTLGEANLPTEFFSRPDGRHSVLLVINGKQIQFQDFIEQFCENIAAEVRQAARKVAADKLRLSTVTDRLSRLSDTIHRELDELFPGTRREDE